MASTGLEVRGPSRICIPQASLLLPQVLSPLSSLWLFFAAIQFLKNVPEKEAAILEPSEQVLKIDFDLATWAASSDFFPEIETKSKNKTKETYAFYFRAVLGLL